MSQRHADKSIRGANWLVNDPHAFAMVSNGEKANGNRDHEDKIQVPKTMSEALEFEDPVEALRLLAEQSERESHEDAKALEEAVSNFQLTLPDIKSSSLQSVKACSDSIVQSLSKISQGGSEASQEIRQLETRKHELDSHAQAIEHALLLRKSTEAAFPALQRQDWVAAAEAVAPFLVEFDDERAQSYAGEYCIKQLNTAYTRLREELLKQYDAAVQKGDVEALGELTPVLGLVRLEPDAVTMYLQYLRGLLQDSFMKVSNPKEAVYMQTARIYNAAVATLRHHLPLVSHCLYKADGDAAVVQLVNIKVEDNALPLLEQYQKERQLANVSKRAQSIYAALEERITGRQRTNEDRESGHNSENNEDDCGFSVAIGSLSDADAAMEETARCLQNSESYIRFMHHTCAEVNKARKLRFEADQEQLRLERQRAEWKGDGSQTNGPIVEEKEFKPLPILAEATPLHLTIAEIGGQYASIERCLLLATMQRSFVSQPEEDTRYYRPVTMTNVPKGIRAQQTALVESCFYATRHSAQRAFATGHASTASAVANFCNDCISGVLLDVLTHRAEERGVTPLRPGEGLLVGSAGLFNNASNLIRQGAQSKIVVGHGDDADRKQRQEKGLAQACAILNDLDVASHNSEQLEVLLSQAVQRGFDPSLHETEQLALCVKSIGSLSQSFKTAANEAMEALESLLQPRLRAIVNEAVGSDNTSSTFMSSSVMRGGNATDRTMSRMHYELDEETYNLLQLSESYITRLCTLLDELIEPLRKHLLPRLWDRLLIDLLGTVTKRLDSAIRKCSFTALGALALDSDMRDLLNFSKDRLQSPELSASNTTVLKACAPMNHLLQTARLLAVDDLEDVLDLINSAKRKGNWDLKIEDTKDLLCLRVEFEDANVRALLRLPDD